MSRAVVFHPEAGEEARRAYLWYADRSESAAQAFLRELDRAVEQIAEGPERWPTYFHGTRRYLLRRFPFSIIYRIHGGAVQVIAVAHGRRKPGYWKSRRLA